LNANKFLATLRGEAGAGRIAALMTAAAGLVVTGQAPALRDGATLAAAALDGGRALAILERLRAVCGLAGKA
jgi:anthranilate phosphoribosyltransferase